MVLTPSLFVAHSRAPSDRSSLSVEAASQSGREGGPGDSRAHSVDGHTAPLLPAGASSHGDQQAGQAPKSPGRRASSPLGGLFGGAGGRKTKHARHGSKGSITCWGVQEGTE